jgi:hypothetical protein
VRPVGASTEIYGVQSVKSPDILNCGTESHRPGSGDSLAAAAALTCPDRQSFAECNDERLRDILPATVHGDPGKAEQDKSWTQDNFVNGSEQNRSDGCRVSRCFRANSVCWAAVQAVSEAPPAVRQDGACLLVDSLSGAAQIGLRKS